VVLAPSLVSALHLLALGIGLGAVWARGRALRGSVDVAAVLRADNWWGVAAVLWIATGLTRALGGLEKGWAFYRDSPLFWVKMALLGAVFALELWPMATFLRWRLRQARDQPIDLRHAAALRRLNLVEVALTVAIPFVAAGMARGLLR
jgi:putative membrane protein